jgi:hypothetical protein
MNGGNSRAPAVSGQAPARNQTGGKKMSTLADRLREYVDALQKQVTHLKDSADQAREETSAQVGARIEQAKADVAAHQEPTREQAGQAAGRAQSQWQSMKADAAAKMQDLQDRIGRKHDQLDAKMAEDDAEAAEADAADALDYARWAAEQAELAVLDAIDARTWADERAAASLTS